MGIILKCGDNCVLYNSYDLWNLFKIELFKAVKIFLDQFNHVPAQQPLKFENELIGFEQSERITSYLIYTMKNIECLKILQVEGIYHLLIISNKEGFFYTHDKSEKICRMIDLVKSHINIEKLNITAYMNLFEKSSTNKQPIYIL